MKAAGTLIPAEAHACVVFGAPSEGQPPKAGIFAGDQSKRASKLARRNHLFVIQLKDTKQNRQYTRIPPGTITHFGQLRLREIGPDVLNRLQAQYHAQTSQQEKADGGNAPASKSEPEEDQPGTPGGSEPPGSPDLGPSLLKAYRQLDVAGRWLERTQAELADLLGRVSSGSDFSFQAEAEITEFDHYSSGDGWVVDGWRWCFPARYRRQRIGDLSVVVDLGRPGRPANSLAIPCLLVLWSSPTRDWSSTVDAAAGFWPIQRDGVELTEGRVFRWVGPAPGNGSATALSYKEGAWYYVVELAGVSNLAALRTHVVQPALALLAGKSVQEAFAKAPAVMHFRQHQGTLKRDAKSGAKA